MNSYTTADIEKNLGLVYTVVLRNTHWWSDMNTKEDLISWGVIGLVHALKHYDSDRGTAFSSYAMKCIYGYTLQGIRSNCKEIWYGKEQGRKYISIPIDTVKEKQFAYRERLDDMISAKETVSRFKALLTNRQREIVDLMVEHDFNKAEVAKVIGTSRQNVFHIWNDAIKNIQEDE